MHTYLNACIPPGRLQRLAWMVAVIVALSVALGACGFRLKGTTPLPFETLYTNISDNSAFGAAMRRAVVASSPNTRFVSDQKQAQARLIQLANNQSRRELSIDASGHVEEYELNLEFIFQLTDGRGRVVLAPTTLRATREVPYDPDDAQAKSDEIAMIFQDMQQSMVSRVVRRLGSPDVTEAFERVSSEPVGDIAEGQDGDSIRSEDDRSPDPDSGAYHYDNDGDLPAGTL